MFDFLRKYAKKNVWYLFYIKDKDGVLCAVDANWNGDGWYLNAHSVAGQYRWYDDILVVSRNFEIIKS